MCATFNKRLYFGVGQLTQFSGHELMSQPKSVHFGMAMYVTIQWTLSAMILFCSLAVWRIHRYGECPSVFIIFIFELVWHLELMLSTNLNGHVNTIWASVKRETKKEKDFGWKFDSYIWDYLIFGEKFEICINMTNFYYYFFHPIIGCRFNKWQVSNKEITFKINAPLTKKYIPIESNSHKHTQTRELFLYIQSLSLWKHHLHNYYKKYTVSFVGVLNSNKFGMRITVRCYD